MIEFVEEAPIVIAYIAIVMVNELLVTIPVINHSTANGSNGNDIWTIKHNKNAVQASLIAGNFLAIKNKTTANNNPKKGKNKASNIWYSTTA